MRRMIVTPEEKQRLLLERRKRFDVVVDVARTFLTRNLPADGSMPCTEFMADLLRNHTPFVMGDKVEHIDYRGLVLQVAGACSTKQAYQPDIAENFYSMRPSASFIRVYVRLFDNPTMRQRAVPAIKLVKI